MLEEGFELKNVKKLCVTRKVVNFIHLLTASKLKKAGREISKFGIYYLP